MDPLQSHDCADSMMAGGSPTSGGSATGGGNFGHWVRGGPCEPVRLGRVFPTYGVPPGNSVIRAQTNLGFGMSLFLWQTRDAGLRLIGTTLPVAPDGGGAWAELELSTRPAVVNATGFVGTSGQVTLMSGSAGDLELTAGLQVRFDEYSTRSAADGGAQQLLVDGGYCATYSGILSTVVNVGTRCEFGSDCAAKVCAPSSATCQWSTCDGGTSTSSSKCARQGSGGYAEYPRCDQGLSCPSGTNCSSDRLSFYLRDICLAYGTSTLGQVCRLTDVNSGCAAGLLCTSPSQLIPTRCASRCDYLASVTGCASTERCAAGNTGACLPALTGNVLDRAQLGQSCGTFSLRGAACADDGQRYLGLCTEGDGGLHCRPVCGPSKPCVSGQCVSASPAFGNEFTSLGGVCSP